MYWTYGVIVPPHVFDERGVLCRFWFAAVTGVITSMAARFKTLCSA